VSGAGCRTAPRRPPGWRQQALLCWRVVCRMGRIRVRVLAPRWSKFDHDGCQRWAGSDRPFSGLCQSLPSSLPPPLPPPLPPSLPPSLLLSLAGSHTPNQLISLGLSASVIRVGPGEARAFIWRRSETAGPGPAAPGRLGRRRRRSVWHRHTHAHMHTCTHAHMHIPRAAATRGSKRRQIATFRGGHIATAKYRASRHQIDP
jgi:ABC-type nickel/cobalt efflux system permease component RcnA